MRRVVARWLRRAADRMDSAKPSKAGRTITVRVKCDTSQFDVAMAKVQRDLANAQRRVSS